jgi:protein-S-isoprenylcysteine O-methyltransferase Ste14
MADESTFRIFLTIIFATFLFIWLRNFLSVGISRNALYTPTEGLLVAVPLRLLLGASVAGIVVYLINPARMAWSTIPLPLWIRWLGLPLGLFAVFLIYWVLKSLGQNFSTSLTIKEKQTLVSHGPYRRVRHPMYTAFILLWVAFLLLSANWFIGFTGIMAFVWTTVIRTPKEEQMMADRFGEEYLAYKERTGRYLPRRLMRDDPDA